MNYKYNIIKSNRKSYLIKVSGENEVTIKVPKVATMKEIKYLISENNNTIKKLVDNYNKCYRITYEIDTFVPFDAKMLKLTNKIENDSLMLVKNTQSYYIKKEVYEIYRNRVKDIVEIYVDKYAKIIGVEPNRILIKNQKKRFGSCSTKKNININLKCAIFSHEVIEYILVHEMCHLIHLNHQRSFYNLFRSIMPDYKDRKKKLKQEMINICFDEL